MSNMWNCMVQVTDANGKPRSGTKVTLFGAGLLGGHLEAYTASDGWAEVSNPSSDRSDWIVESIYISGNKVCGSKTIRNGERLSFSI